MNALQIAGNLPVFEGIDTLSFERLGYQVVRGFFSSDEVGHFKSHLNELGLAPGHRQVMQRVPEVRAPAHSSRISDLLTKLLRKKPSPVRSIFFDKTPETNWSVPWDQDLSIAVQKQNSLFGYGPWSNKEGVPHVQPPREILESMITLRIHLDDCDESNGALQVIPGTHLSGRLDANQIGEFRGQKKGITCSVRAGDVLLMRPLILHASSAAVTPSHRRVIHLEYASCDLPVELKWAES